MIRTEILRLAPPLILTVACLWHCSQAEWLDLSYSFDNTTIYWPGNTPFSLTHVDRGQTEYYWIESNDLSAAEHGGTHMDAPCHLWKGGWTIDEIPPDRFIAHAALIDITERSKDQPDAVVTPEDLEAWKKQHGDFVYPTILLVRTGHSEHWHNRTRYLGIQPEEPDLLHFPGIGETAARDLAGEQNVVGVGLDTPSLDPGNSVKYRAHQILFEANKFGIENIANMSRVPAAGAMIVALPMKIRGGSGGPCRVMVDVPSEEHKSVPIVPSEPEPEVNATSTSTTTTTTSTTEAPSAEEQDTPTTNTTTTTTTMPPADDDEMS